MQSALACHAFYRMNSVAFIVIAILTLAAALAAATLQKLMHAALSFALAFVGIAAFFFLLGAVFVGLLWAIFKTRSISIVAPEIPALTVERIGQVLMTGYVWPLQCVGLLLTAALIGALILVMEEKR